MNPYALIIGGLLVIVSALGWQGYKALRDPQSCAYQSCAIRLWETNTVIASPRLRACHARR